MVTVQGEVSGDSKRSIIYRRTLICWPTTLQFTPSYRYIPGFQVLIDKNATVSASREKFFLSFPAPSGKWKLALPSCSHLLGKKSWNVYNADNIERVRRDEAAAQAKEEAEEQRMQEVDAARRLAILRGEEPPPLEDDEASETKQLGAPEADDAVSRAVAGASGVRRKRKRPGEDDTDFEMRLANERNETRYGELEHTKKPTSSAPITDHRGHIDLFGDERARAHAEKNDDSEREKKKKKQEQEDQYTMRFSNAAGKDGTGNPWYSQSELSHTTSSKDVWGNDDPTRKERDAKRAISNDPLAMMKMGASKVREIKAERKKAQAEQHEELRKLRREQRHDRHRDGKRSREHGRRSSRSRSRERFSRYKSERRQSPSDSRRHEDRSHGEHRSSRHKDEDKDRRHRHSKEQDREYGRRERTHSHRDRSR